MNSLLHVHPNNRFGTLSLSLLASSILHALAVGHPYIGQAIEIEAALFSGKQDLHSTLHVALNHSAKFGLATEIAPLVAIPVLKQELHNKPSKKIPDELQADLNPDQWRDSSPLLSVNYYATNELTLKPFPLGEPALDPDEITAIAETGEIVLALWISEQGAVIDVTVDHSNLPVTLSQAVARAFQNLQFIPGELNGQKVSAVMIIEVMY